MSDSAKLFTDINLIQEFTSSYRDFIKRKLVVIVASSNERVFFIVITVVQQKCADIFANKQGLKF